MKVNTKTKCVCTVQNLCKTIRENKVLARTSCCMGHDCQHGKHYLCLFYLGATFCDAECLFLSLLWITSGSVLCTICIVWIKARSYPLNNLSGPSKTFIKSSRLRCQMHFSKRLMSFLVVAGVLGDRTIRTLASLIGSGSWKMAMIVRGSFSWQEPQGIFVQKGTVWKSWRNNVCKRILYLYLFVMSISLESCHSVC